LFFISLIFVFSVGTALAQETSNPLVELKNQYSGKCLAVKGGNTGHGALLIHIDCGSGGPNAIWEMQPEGTAYRIANKHSGLCLGVAHQSKKDGEQVTQVSPCSRTDTVWKVEYMTPGPTGIDYGKPIVVRNSNSNKCLALVTGNKIKQYGCPPHRPKTTWQFVEAKESQTAPSGRVPIHARENIFPFYLDGKAYLFEKTSAGKTFLGWFDKKPLSNAANWYRISDDPKNGFIPMVKGAKMSSKNHLYPFTRKNHPYLLGFHETGTNIWRINNDGKGFELVMHKGKPFRNYGLKVIFQLKGEPYLFGIHETGANIFRINEGDKGFTFELVKRKIPNMNGHYWRFHVFYIDGHPYILGFHKSPKGILTTYISIFRVKDDPSQGLDLVTSKAKLPDYAFIRFFHLNGRPYIFAAVLQAQRIPTTMIDVGMAIAQGLFLSDWSGIYEPGQGYGVIWEISGDPNHSLSLNKITPKAIPISWRYKNLITFEQGGKAYIFGIHEENYANIWQVNDDPSRGFALEYYGRNK
jgi:hypothetical protein